MFFREKRGCVITGNERLRGSVEKMSQKNSRMSQMNQESKSLTEVNNIIWSPPETLENEKFLDRIHTELVTGVHNRDREEWTRSPLNLATHKMRPDIIKMLVTEAGINVNSVDQIKDCQRCALTVAISRKRVDTKDIIAIIELLIDELGADVNRVLTWKYDKGEEGTTVFTPLLWAIMHEKSEITSLLLEKGADDEFPGAVIGPGKVWVYGEALEVARKLKSSREIIDLLETHKKNKVSNKAVIQVGKPAWTSIISTHKNGSQWKEIEDLVSDPDYMTQQEIEEEKEELLRRERALERKIRISREIDEKIRRLKQSSAKNGYRKTSREMQNEDIDDIFREKETVQTIDIEKNLHPLRL